MPNKIEKIVEDALRPVIEGMGIELVDVEYRKRNDNVNITVFIYRAEGTDLDTCEKVHRAIDPVLDEIDPTNGEGYILNVSSPGLDRAYKTDSDFLRNIGNDVEIKFFSPYDGKKKLTAKLLALNESNIEVQVEDKKLLIKRDKIAKINSAITF